MSEEKPLNVPEYLLIRSAEARAKHLGISVEQALAEIKGESQPVEEPVVEDVVEDVVEELFGEIEDEHDIQELVDVRINENEFKLSARLEIDYLNEEYNLNIPKEEAYETLGGFIINQTENIPQKDEELSVLNYKIKILDVSSSKIEEISLKVLDAEEN